MTAIKTGALKMTAKQYLQVKSASGTYKTVSNEDAITISLKGEPTEPTNQNKDDAATTLSSIAAFTALATAISALLF